MACESNLPEPGLIVLFGSGETSPTGRKVFEHIFHSLPPSPRLALLETPAGFQPNSYRVISQVGDFFARRFQNYTPRVEIIPARKRGTPFSPDEQEIVTPLLHADLIFMGPGSPSYAIQQLRESLAWHYLIARHRLGAVLALASAATVAFSACALPVYEIYKVGEDLHWIEGLNFFNLYGLQMIFIPHWNNNEGGAELDTSRCFMGQERFSLLMEMLPKGMTIIGLDEKTALIIDPAKSECLVKGLGKVTLIHTGHNHQPYVDESLSGIEAKNIHTLDDDVIKIAERRFCHVHQYHDMQVFPMGEIGHFHPYHPESSLPYGIWQKAVSTAKQMQLEKLENPPDQVLQLIQEREKARQVCDWSAADELRERIIRSGWDIMDTKEGPVSRKR